MDPMHIVLIALVLAGAWAVVELALTLRRARGVVDAIDKTVEQVNSTIEEARPVVAKLDGAVDELQPAMAQIEPLLKQATVAVEALSADLIEVNGVLRDVSTVSGAASSASSAVTELADAASDKVQKLFGRGHKNSPNPAPGSALKTLREDAAGGAAPESQPLCPEELREDQPSMYFTYDPSEDRVDE